MIEYTLMVVVLFTAGWLVVYGRGNVWLRAVTVLALILSSVGIIERVERYRGTPRVAELPDEVLVRGYVVDEGNKIIYLYCGGIPPESIIVPYERSMHEALQGGTKAFKGKPFKMKSTQTAEEGDQERSISTRSERKFIVELPRAILPEK